MRFENFFVTALVTAASLIVLFFTWLGYVVIRAVLR